MKTRIDKMGLGMGALSGAFSRVFSRELPLAMSQAFLLVLTLALTLGAVPSVAQRYPERREIRSGNGLYERGNYVEAEVSYRRALEQAPQSTEAQFNLAGALYKQERYEEAAQVGEQLLADSLPPLEASAAHFNRGNALFKQRKFEEAIEAYKEALRQNPGDQQAKFNLAYAQKMLSQEQNQEQQQPKPEQQGDSGGGGGGGSNQSNQPEQQDKPQNQNQQATPQGGLTPQEAEQMLEAIQSNDENTREKIDGRQVRQTTPSGRNW